MLARILQVLLGSMGIPPSQFENPVSWIAALKKIVRSLDGMSSVDPGWMHACVKLLETAVCS